MVSGENDLGKKGMVMSNLKNLLGLNGVDERRLFRSLVDDSKLIDRSNSQ